MCMSSMCLLLRFEVGDYPQINSLHSSLLARSFKCLRHALWRICDSEADMVGCVSRVCNTCHFVGPRMRIKLSLATCLHMHHDYCITTSDIRYQLMDRFTCMQRPGRTRWRLWWKFSITRDVTASAPGSQSRLPFCSTLRCISNEGWCPEDGEISWC